MSPAARRARATATGAGLAVVCAATALVLLLSRPASQGASPGGGWRPQLIVLVEVCGLRPDRLGCYGNPAPVSPVIDRIAADGVVFENAFAQANHTLYSSSSILTGLYPSRLFTDAATSTGLPGIQARRDGNRALPPPHAQSWIANTGDFHAAAEHATVASELSAQGYRTVSYAGNFLAPALGFGHGFDVVHNGFTALDSAAVTRTPTFALLYSLNGHPPFRAPLGLSRLQAPGYDGIGLELVGGSAYGWMYVADGRYHAARYKADLAAHREGSPMDAADPTVALEDADVGYVRSAYDGAVTSLDMSLGELMEQIHALQLQDRTLLVVVGEYGASLLEHGYIFRAGRVDHELAHVPLIVWAPGALRGGARVRDIVELVDVMPTILDLVGVRPLPDLPGRSLVELARGGGRRESTEGDGSRVAMSFSVGQISFWGAAVSGVLQATPSGSGQRAPMPMRIADRRGEGVISGAQADAARAAFEAVRQARLRPGWTF